LKSTTRIANTIVQLAYDAKNYDLLNLNIKTLEKKHGQLKAVVQSVVEQAMAWLEPIKESEGIERWLELIETLRTVTEGKVSSTSELAHFRALTFLSVSRSSSRLLEPVLH
jgi:26S proteasome regulatory subunit N5